MFSGTPVSTLESEWTLLRAALTLGFTEKPRAPSYSRVRVASGGRYDKMDSLHNRVRSAVDFCRDSFGAN